MLLERGIKSELKGPHISILMMFSSSSPSYSMGDKGSHINFLRKMKLLMWNINQKLDEKRDTTNELRKWRLLFFDKFYQLRWQEGNFRMMLWQKYLLLITEFDYCSFASALSQKCHLSTLKQMTLFLSCSCQEFMTFSCFALSNILFYHDGTSYQ